jgi:transposase
VTAAPSFDELKQAHAALQADHRRLQARYHQAQLKIAKFEEERRLARARRFGASSEVGDYQANLFDEADAHADQAVDDVAMDDRVDTIDVAAHRKRRPIRKPLPQDLPRVVVNHDLPEAQKRCGCGGAMQVIGEKVTEQLDVIPAQVFVLEHHRPTYSCSKCDESIITASLPPQPIPKSLASPGLLAHVAVAKYADGLPLYRQSKQFERLGIEMPRNTLAGHMVKAGALIEPLISLLCAHIRGHDIVQMDETPVQVLKEPGKVARSKSYMWVMKGGPPAQPAIHGVGCWAHVRRRFVDARKALPKPQQNKATRVHQALALIGKLYQLEQAIRDLPPEARLERRQQDAVAILDRFKAWLDTQSVPPQSALGRAVRYALGQWPRLLVYTEDGRLNIDNNGVENAIRPFALGRKNWLFSDTQGGVIASANLYSLIETAKANGINDYAYLKLIFAELPASNSPAQLTALLPWNIDRAMLEAQLNKPA